jgi:hypothetical protein
MPTSRWTEDGEAYLSSPLNSRSLNGIEYLMWQLEPKMSVRQINNWTSNGGEGTRYFSHATWTSDYREPEVVQFDDR